MSSLNNEYITCFFAIVPPKALHAPLANLLHTLNFVFPEQSLKWIKVENLHITLQFLSCIQQDQIAFLVNSAQTALKETPAFQLEFGAVEWFPSLTNPKLLSLDVGPHNILKTISVTIGQALSSLNYPMEGRPFRGHMSMGKNLQKLPSYDLLTQIKTPIIPSVLINKIHLMESRVSHDGRSYHSLAEFNLT
ncbi:RNA 2',3'-cyclic phosphodiesterase [Legionella drancourtii]|nr:RNA 2',3'-cyclic phosphodiesterase [Legionella drancourtii]